MSSNCADVRDEAYLRVGIKKAALGFVNNDFDLSKVSIPREDLETLVQSFPDGKVYIVAHSPGDISNTFSKGASKASTREFCVYVGFQVPITDVNDLTEMDPYYELVEQLEDLCRKEFNLDPFQFSRLEYFKDERGHPNSFVVERSALFFEAYFMVYYLRTIT